ncbi:serine acetyltransferase, partial [Vibrio parahaemolyticus]
MISDYIKSDLCRYVGKDGITLGSFVKNYFFNSGFKLCVWLRIGKFTSSKALKLIAKIQHRRISKKHFLDIPIETDIGYGLYIGHGKAIVINPTAKIGNNVNLSQFTTIGSNHGQAAYIGNNVYI